MDVNTNEPPPSPFGRNSSLRWPRDAYVIIVLVLAGSWLLTQWQFTAAQWTERGCVEDAHIRALVQGEPEWYEFCTKKERS